MQKLTPTDLQFVVRRIPKDVRTLMQNNFLLVGGGFVRETIAGNEVKDIDLFSNDKPLLVAYQGEYYFPIVKNYPETVFGGDFASEFSDDVLAEFAYGHRTLLIETVEQFPDVRRGPYKVGECYVLRHLRHGVLVDQYIGRTGGKEFAARFDMDPLPWFSIERNRFEA